MKRRRGFEIGEVVARREAVELVDIELSTLERDGIARDRRPSGRRAPSAASRASGGAPRARGRARSPATRVPPSESRLCTPPSTARYASSAVALRVSTRQRPPRRRGRPAARERLTESVTERAYARFSRNVAVTFLGRECARLVAMRTSRAPASGSRSPSGSRPLSAGLSLTIATWMSMRGRSPIPRSPTRATRARSGLRRGRARPRGEAAAKCRGLAAARRRAQPSLNVLFVRYAVYGLLAHPGSLPGATVAAALGSSTWVILISSLVLLLLTFPHGRLPSPRWRVAVWTLLVFGALTWIANTFEPGPLVTSVERLREPVWSRGAPFGGQTSHVRGVPAGGPLRGQRGLARAPVPGRAETSGSSTNGSRSRLRSFLSPWSPFRSWTLSSVRYRRRTRWRTRSRLSRRRPFLSRRRSPCCGTAFTTSTGSSPAPSSTASSPSCSAASTSGSYLRARPCSLGCARVERRGCAVDTHRCGTLSSCPQAGAAFRRQALLPQQVRRGRDAGAFRRAPPTRDGSRHAARRCPLGGRGGSRAGTRLTVAPKRHRWFARNDAETATR